MMVRYFGGRVPGEVHWNMGISTAVVLLTPLLLVFVVPFLIGLVRVGELFLESLECLWVTF